MVNRTNCCRPAMLLLLALAWTAGGCATYRPITIGKQPDSDAAGSGQLPPFAGDRVRVTMASSERLTGMVISRTPAVIVIGGADDKGKSGRAVDVAAIKSLEMVQRPLATSSIGGALETLVLIGVIAGTMLLVLNPPYGDS